MPIGSSTREATASLNRERTGIKCDKRRLANYTGYSVSWIEKLMKEGAPIAQKGGRGRPTKIDSAQFIQWMLERERERAKEQLVSSGELAAIEDDDGAMLIDEAERRYKVARAKNEELRYEQAQGNLVEIDRACEVVENIIANCRARLLAIPRKTAPMVASITEIGEVSDLMERDIYEALDELGRFDPADFLPEGDDETVESAAQTDGESVGGPVPDAES